MTGQIVAVTGHRPQHLAVEDGYWIQGEFERLIEKLQPSVAISGMALGADTWWASAAIDATVPVHAYVPFPEQDARWRQDDRNFYRSLLAQAERVVMVSDHYHPAAFDKRNVAMVDNSSLLIAAWNGKTHGGTWNCLTYARSVKRPLVMVDVRSRTTAMCRPVSEEGGPVGVTS